MTGGRQDTLKGYILENIFKINTVIHSFKNVISGRMKMIAVRGVYFILTFKLPVAGLTARLTLFMFLSRGLLVLYV